MPTGKQNLCPRLQSENLKPYLYQLVPLTGASGRKATTCCGYYGAFRRNEATDTWSLSTITVKASIRLHKTARQEVGNLLQPFRSSTLQGRVCGSEYFEHETARLGRGRLDLWLYAEGSENPSNERKDCSSRRRTRGWCRNRAVLCGWTVSCPRRRDTPLGS